MCVCVVVNCEILEEKEKQFLPFPFSLCCFTVEADVEKCTYQTFIQDWFQKLCATGCFLVSLPASRAACISQEQGKNCYWITLARHVVAINDSQMASCRRRRGDFLALVDSALNWTRESRSSGKDDHAIVSGCRFAWPPIWNKLFEPIAKELLAESCLVNSIRFGSVDNSIARWLFYVDIMTGSVFIIFDGRVVCVWRVAAHISRCERPWPFLFLSFSPNSQLENEDDGEIAAAALWGVVRSYCACTCRREKVVVVQRRRPAIAEKTK